uniref:Uncharacterized protein n=1 Tax=Aegilops tauschii subsp. strangulata TaxID=200361 RepID=A0A453SNF8_AEGTS
MVGGTKQGLHPVSGLWRPQRLRFGPFIPPPEHRRRHLPEPRSSPASHRPAVQNCVGDEEGV